MARTSETFLHDQPHGAARLRAEAWRRGVLVAGGSHHIPDYHRHSRDIDRVWEGCVIAERDSATILPSVVSCGSFFCTMTEHVTRIVIDPATRAALPTMLAELHLHRRRERLHFAEHPALVRAHTRCSFCLVTGWFVRYGSTVTPVTSTA